jgi:hypothetical protein
MQFKTSIIIFFILMSIGAGSYVAAKKGFYPVASVDLNLISAKSFQENSSAAYRYFQNALFVSGSDPHVLETLEAHREIRRATLDKLITDELIYGELQVRIKDDFQSIAEKNVEQYIQNNKNISEGAEKIYGLNLADFKSQVLMPEAYKEILQGRMFLNKENFDEWLKNKKSGARIIILSPDLQWNGSSVKLSPA